MKSEQRMAGLFGSLAFLVVTVKGYAATFDPLHSLLWGMGACLVLGFIGYKIGYIVGHPKGKRHLSSKKKKLALFSVNSGNNSHEERTPLTGEETFIDDLDG